MTFWPSVSAAMGIGGGSRQCCRKCHPIWALQLQKRFFVWSLSSQPTSSIISKRLISLLCIA